MTLIEAVFKRSKEARGCITFKEIAHECRVGLGEVEHLIMKALSLGLVKGSIDEISQVVQVYNNRDFITKFSLYRLLGFNQGFWIRIRLEF